MFSNKKWTIFIALAAIVAMVLPACAPPTPQVIEKQVPVEKKVVETVVVEKEVPVEVEKEKVVEKEVVKTVVVEKEVEKEVVVTATPEPTPEPTPLPEWAEMKNPDTLVHATIGTIRTLDPPFHYDTSSATAIWQIYEPLVFYNREKPDEFVPMLAEDWDISDDGKTYTFHIRQGVKFHEGGDLTPEDLAYSFQRAMIQDRSGGPMWMFWEPLMGYGSIKSLAKDIAGVDSFEDVDEASLVETCEKVKEAITYDNDEWTVTLNLVDSWGPMLMELAQPWFVGLDKEWMIEQGGWDGSCETWVDFHDPMDEESVLFDQMNGTGPFKLEEWVPGDEIRFVRNEDYWRTEPMWEGGPSGPAALKRAIIKRVPEWGTRFAMFKAGDADICYVPRQYKDQVMPFVKEIYTDGEAVEENLTIHNPDGNIRVFPGLFETAAADGFFTFKVNTEGGNPYIGSGEFDGNGVPADFFSDEHVRKAFNYAFDWETAINDVFMGEAIQRRGPIIAGHLGYEEDSAVFSHDMAKAEEEFKAAWDGEVWEKGFYLQIMYNTGNDQRKTFCEILEQNIESINPKFNVTVVDVPWATYLREMDAGRLPMFFIGWIEDYHHPHNWVTPYMASTGTFSAWQRMPDEFYEKADAMIAEAAKLPPDQAHDKYAELQNLATNEYVIDIFGVQAQGRHWEQLWVDGWYFNPAYFGLWFYVLDKG